MTTYNEIPNLVARIADLERRVKTGETAPRLAASGVGEGGIKIHDGGSITVEDGGDIIINDDGSLISYSADELRYTEVSGGWIRFKSGDTTDPGLITAWDSGGWPVLGIYPPGTANTGTTSETYIYLAGESPTNGNGHIWLTTTGGINLDGVEGVKMASTGGAVELVTTGGTGPVNLFTNTGEINLTASNADIDITTGNSVNVQADDNFIMYTGNVYMEAQLDDGYVNINTRGSMYLTGENIAQVDSYSSSELRVTNTVGVVRGAVSVTPTTVLLTAATDTYLTLTSAGLNVPHTTTSSAANAVLETTGLLKRSTSSLRYKTDVEDLTLDAVDVLKLRPRTWRDKIEVNEDEKTDTRYVGFIAEELDEIGLGAFVLYDDENRPDAIAYDRLSAALVQVLKSQQVQIDALAKRVDELS